MESVREVAEKFGVLGRVENFEICGLGHIHTTYLVSTRHEYGNFKYIVQKINHHVFRDVDGLMNNMMHVTEYIRESVKQRGEDCGRATIHLLKTTDGRPYYKDRDGNYYRAYVYIGNVASVTDANDPHQIYLSGIGFGKFQQNLDGFDSSLLIETIPNFHNTVKRYENLENAIAQDALGRAKNVQDEIEFFRSRKHYASVVLDMMKDGSIPTRVTHNDTKINNVLIDPFEDRPVTVIDLDTVMPGSILYDFGDSIRSGAKLGAEDEPDLKNVGFSLEYFEAFTRGFVPEVKDRLTTTEIDNLAFGAILMTYENGLRFLTDYLEGDVYFKIHRPNHNLDRARTQIKLITLMEEALPEMNRIVKKYAY